MKLLATMAGALALTMSLTMSLGTSVEARPSQAGPAQAGKVKAQSRSSVNTRPQHQVSNQQAYKAGKAAGGRQQRDVVVVGNPGHGHYDNGHYNGPRDWDDDDNEVLEFIGKTAAVTAGVSVVTAVIGEVVKDQPSGCQPANIGGQQYLNCNGTFYQPVPNGYQVVAPPQ
ncbi:hypothetical protein L6Q21_08855 [Sandaracinobacter sp. RS1-74]|uniref:DUF6515 family protein n=1 Tax=Sandaracinobacteroides sayramensis TaxID=2913411 RepID=UPI001EDAA58F|nr:DUF6515 family protein [Sandaracinobacteroides sayramensis]MCG2841088.1 hypothetical protein [Sandaracinobacteroides sayramensis]